MGWLSDTLGGAVKSVVDPILGSTTTTSSETTTAPTDKGSNTVLIVVVSVVVLGIIALAYWYFKSPAKKTEQ